MTQHAPPYQGPPPAGHPAGHTADPGGGGFRRAYRDADTPILGGVASGLARHLGINPTYVRLAFIVTTAIGGVGLWVYAGLWMFLPSDSRFTVDTPGAESATRTGKRPSRVRRLTDAGPVIVLGVLAMGVVILLGTSIGQATLFWPAVIAVAGIGLLWRQADEVQRERWLDATGRIDLFRSVFGSGGWASYARVVAGVLLVLVAISVYAALDSSGSGPASVFVAGLMGVIGLALVVVPFATRLASDLGAERAERIRTQERADLAAHLHDSVLQTLALIQKNAGDGPTVARLARAQERDLRSWLYAGESTEPATFGGALREIAARVEDEHGIVVDVVTVGETDSADNEEWLRPLVAATGEAVTNAAKHAGTGRVDVFAEVTPGGAEVFVRDRGAGFDPEEIPEGRLGVRHSILGRMERHGGTAEIRSTPGAGTEVRLSMSRPRAEEQS